MAGRHWIVEVAGLPCRIDSENGEWVVILASTTIGRSIHLDTAIVRACGGLVSSEEARSLAASVAGTAQPERARAASSPRP